MLQDNPQNKSCESVFAAVPRKAGQEPETAPLATVTVPKGIDFCIQVVIITVIALVCAYLLSVGIGVLIAFVNMIMGSCGQDTWVTDAETACKALVTNSFALSLDLRCFDDKPEAMTQDDFDGTCGDGIEPYIGLIVTLFFTITMTVNGVYKELAKIPSKVRFHEKLFTVESWSKKQFICSYYADVTGAKSGMDGLKITSKARISLLAGGEDENDKKGKVLTIKGDSHFTVLSGSGKAQQEFLQKFAEYLPVNIENFDGSSPVRSATASPTDPADEDTMMTGRVKEILTARRAGPSTFEAVRKPITCDFFAEVIFICLCVLVVWYVGSVLFGQLITWAINKGMDKCVDPMKPGEDMCAVWRIFVPISVPITHAGDYFAILWLAVASIAVPSYYFLNMPVEYRFHTGGIVQELFFAGWESQPSIMVFQDDVEGLEFHNGSLEKYVKVKAKASYTVTKGVNKPFKIVGKFSPSEVKVALVDGSCASCSGHGAQAKNHQDEVLKKFNTLKPGMLPAPEEA